MCDEPIIQIYNCWAKIFQLLFPFISLVGFIQVQDRTRDRIEYTLSMIISDSATKWGQLDDAFDLISLADYF